MIGLIQRVLIDHLEASHDGAVVGSIAVAGDCQQLDRQAPLRPHADPFVGSRRRYSPMFFSMAKPVQAFLPRLPVIHAATGAGIGDDGCRFEMTSAEESAR